MLIKKKIDLQQMDQLICVPGHLEKKDLITALRVFIGKGNNSVSAGLGSTPCNSEQD